MSELIKKNKVALAIGLFNLLVTIIIAYCVLSFNKDKFELTHQDHNHSQNHSQIIQKIDNPDRCFDFDKEFLRLLENENSTLHNRLEQCNKSYDVLLDDYFEFL